jgi:hypothetical protein
MNMLRLHAIICFQLSMYLSSLPFRNILHPLGSWYSQKSEQLNQNFCSYSQGYTWAKKRWRLGVAMHCQGCNTPAKGLKVKSILVGRGPSTAPSLPCERAERAGRSLRGSRSVGCGATWRNTCLCDASMGQRKDMLDKTEPRCSARRR